MSHRRMRTIALIPCGLFPLNGFRCNFVSALSLKYSLVYYHDTLQLCRTGHDDVSHTKMTTLACILFELIPLNCLSCNALYFEYRQDYFHEIKRFCRRGRDNVSCIQSMAAVMFTLPVTVTTPPTPKKNPGFGFFVKIHLLTY